MLGADNRYSWGWRYGVAHESHQSSEINGCGDDWDAGSWTGLGGGGGRGGWEGDEGLGGGRMNA